MNMVSRVSKNATLLNVRRGNNDAASELALPDACRACVVQLPGSGFKCPCGILIPRRDGRVVMRTPGTGCRVALKNRAHLLRQRVAARPPEFEGFDSDGAGN